MATSQSSLKKTFCKNNQREVSTSNVFAVFIKTQYPTHFPIAIAINVFADELKAFYINCSNIFADSHSIHCKSNFNLSIISPKKLF